MKPSLGILFRLVLSLQELSDNREEGYVMHQLILVHTLLPRTLLGFDPKEAGYEPTSS